jgi:adenosine kinase
MLKDKTTEDKTGLLGSVGNDFYGDLYASLLNKEDIVPVFEKYDEINTGVCCVFCHNRDRGHITDLGASTLISKEYMERVWEKLSDVSLIYTELFILKHRKDLVFTLAEHALSDDRQFGFNLPSFYFIENFTQDILLLWSYVDVVFANVAEAIFFGKLLGLVDDEDDITTLCMNLAKLPKKNKNKKRVVVITCGPAPAHVAEYDHENEVITNYGSYLPEYVDENLIVDTNGAGDAFAGGFLSKFVRNSSLDQCMHAGHWAASVIIQTRGCKIPDDLTYQEL